MLIERALYARSEWDDDLSYSKAQAACRVPHSRHRTPLCNSLDEKQHAARGSSHAEGSSALGYGRGVKVIFNFPLAAANLLGLLVLMTSFVLDSRLLTAVGSLMVLAAYAAGWWLARRDSRPP